MKKFIQKIAAMAITGAMTLASIIPAVAATSQDYVPTVNLNSGIARAAETTGTAVDYGTSSNGITIRAVDTNYNVLENYDTSALIVNNMGGVNAPATATYNNTAYTFSHYEYATSVRNYVASYSNAFEFYVDPPITILAVYTTSTPNPPTGPVVGMYKDPDVKDGKTFYYLNEAASSGTNITGVRANIEFGRSALNEDDMNNSESFSTQAANIYSSKYNNNIQFIVASAITTGGPINFTATAPTATANAQIKVWNFGSEAFNGVEANTARNGITLASVSDFSSSQLTAGDGKIYSKGYNTSASFTVNRGDVVKVYNDGSSVNCSINGVSYNSVTPANNVAKIIAATTGTMTVSGGYLYAVSVNLYASVDVGSSVETPSTETSYTFLQNNQDECTDWLNVSSGSKANFITGRKGSFAESIFENGTVSSAAGQEGISFPSKSTFTITTTGDNQTVKLYMLRSGSGTSDITVTSSSDSGYSNKFTVQNRDSENQEAFEIVLPTAGTYTFTVGSNNTMLFKAELTTSGSSGGATVSNGSIYGIITDSATHNALSGATVSLYDGNTLVATTTTSITGSYTFSGVTTGKTYTVKASMTGYTDNQAVTANLTTAGIKQDIALTANVVSTEATTETTTTTTTTETTTTTTTTETTTTTTTETTTEATTEAPVEVEYYNVVGTGSVTDSTGLVYDFTNSEYNGKRAYASGKQAENAVYGMVDADDNHLIYSETDGLTVLDNSSVSNAAYIPLGTTVSSGTITITGTVKLSSECTNGINIVRFGTNGIGIRYNGSAIVLSDDKTYTDDTISYTPGKDLTFKWVIDIENKTATLTVGNDTITQNFESDQSSDLLVLNTGSTATFDTSCKNLTIVCSESEATTETTTETTTTTTETTTETTTVTNPSSGEVIWHKYWVNDQDVPSDETNDTSYFDGRTTGSNDIGVATSINIDGTTYEFTKRTGSAIPNITFTVDDGYTATLYFVARSNGSTLRDVILTSADGSYDETKEKATSKSGEAPALVTFEALESGKYTLTTSGNVQYSFVGVKLESVGPVTTGTVNVTVQDQNGNKLSGATVSCNGVTGTTNTNGTVSLTKVTAANGLTVNASYEGDTGTNTVDLVAGSSANVTVTINITKGTVKITLKDQNGNLLKGATIKSDDLNGVIWTDNNDGTYTSSAVTQGTYSFYAAYMGENSNAIDIKVEPCVENTGTITLTRTKGDIQAVITSSDGSALSDAKVTATGSDGTVVTLTESAIPGTYVAEGLTAGTYSVVASYDTTTSDGYSVEVSGGATSSVAIQLEVDGLSLERQAKIDTMLETLLAEDNPSNGSMWNSETTSEYKWSYINGCMITAFMDLYEVTGDKEYLTVSDTYQSGFVNKDGTVAGTRTSAVKTSEDLDDVNSGKSLLDLIENSSDEDNVDKYTLCVDEQLTAILDRADRVEGNTLNFFHKASYQHQVWLDGTYMALPYMIQYSRVFPDKEIAGNTGVVNVSNDVVAQFENVYNKMRNPNTGLYYHGYNSRADNKSVDYDISKAMSWARNSSDAAASGNYKVSSVISTAEVDACSSNYWARAMGWYAMALIDSYEEMEKAEAELGVNLTSQKRSIAKIFTDLMDSILNYQDSSTGLWYQVVDKPDGEYNYLESSGSATFAAALMKGYNLGIYADAATAGYSAKHTANEFYSLGLKAFNGLTDNKLNTTGGLEEICGTAGLGGVSAGGSTSGHTSSSASRGPKYKYRDGSYDYYVSEKLATNDAKGAAPYLMAYAQKLLHDKNN